MNADKDDVNTPIGHVYFVLRVILKKLAMHIFVLRAITNYRPYALMLLATRLDKTSSSIFHSEHGQQSTLQ